MIAWLADRVFGPLLAFLVDWSPWLWLAACGVLAVALLTLAPLLFKRWSRVLAAAALAGFVVLWVWQHFAGIARLEEQNAELQQKLDAAETRIGDLDTSISNYTSAVGALERRQRQIRTEVEQARQGLDSGTIKEEVKNDPIQAASDLSDRWNRLGRMSDEATRVFGRPAPSAASASADPDAGR